MKNNWHMGWNELGSVNKQCDALHEYGERNKLNYAQQTKFELNE